MFDDRTRSRARLFAEMVADVAYEHCQRASRESTDAEIRGGLFAGAAGMSMLFAALGRKNEVRELLSIATSKPFKGSGLFTGISGALIAATFARDCLGGYEKLVATLEQALLREMRRRFGERSYDELRERYDLSYGLAGELIALGYVPDEVEPFIERWLAEDGDDPWATFPMGLKSRTTMLGQSHGLAGWLSALAMLPASPRLQRAQAMCDALIAAGNSADSALWWGRSTHDHHPQPQAWCHGTPGVALALMSYGRARGDVRLCMRAQDALIHSLESQGTPQDDALCHGTSGLALVAFAVGLATSNARLLERARHYVEGILDAYDPASPLQHLRDSGSPWGLFRGITGVALATLTVVGGSSASWVRAFGIPVPRHEERGIDRVVPDRSLSTRYA